MNLLIGLGISITAQCTANGSFPIEMEPTLLLSFAFLILSLLSALIVIPLCKFTSPKPFGVLLMAIYILYMLLIILVEVNILWK